MDTIFYNGKIITMDREDNITSAVSTKDGYIVSTGTYNYVKNHVDSDATKIDLKNKTVLPGFIDVHTHMVPTAISLTYNVNGRCPPNRSIQDILERIHIKCKQIPKYTWIIVNTSIMGEKKLQEKRYPYKYELDKVAPDHPVVIVCTVHKKIVNSCALRLAEINKNTVNPPGSIIHKNPDSDEPTGELSECRELLPITNYTHDQIVNSITNIAYDYWLKNGFTSVHSFCNGAHIKAFQEVVSQRLIPLRINVVLYDESNSTKLLDSAINLGISSGFGNNWLRLGGAKFTIDGAFMGLSAATYNLYLSNNDNKNYGILKLENQSYLNKLCINVINNRFDLYLHAFGDKAQDMAINAIEATASSNITNQRCRIEHFGNILTESHRIIRAQSSGIIPVTTIHWLYSFGDFLDQYLGKDRALNSFCLKSMMDAGLNVADCSDTFGAEPMSINPFFNIWCAVNRKTYYGQVLNIEEAISVYEAIKLYTKNAAFAGHEEDIKGSIQYGKLADMIVIDKDILTTDQNNIKDIKVLMSIINGEIVYNSIT